MRLAATAFVLAACLAAPTLAAAQPAPITYASQGSQRAAAGQAEPVSLGLAGGDERSYGYGAQQTRSRQAVIDIRRAGNNGGVTQARAEQPAPPLQTESAPVERGGERPAWLSQERVGPPYEANGRWYVPTPEPGYAQTGQASWYGPTFHGQQTASGEVFDETALTAAHPTLPIPSLVQVTNLENGREVIVRVNDRGPFVGERLIDMSRGAAQALGFEQAGQARVHVRYLGPAPRRVNADGSSVPIAAPIAPAPVAQASVEGPASLLPPESDMTAEEDAAPAPLQMTNVGYSPAATSGAFFVQVGAYSDLTNADRVRAAVESAGPVAVDIRETANGELFRVRVGPWASRVEADAARRVLADLGYGDAVIAAR